MSNEWLCRMPYRGSSLRGVLRAGVRNRLPRYASLSGVPSFYTQVDENIFDSSPHTAGPWSPEAQHGGPPSALMVRQIEQFEPRAGHRIARVGVDLLRPVPLGRLHTHVRRVHQGRRVELLEATVTTESVGSDMETVLIARAWRVESMSDGVPERGSTAGDVPRDVPPGALLDPQTTGFRPHGYLSAIDWSFERGSFADYGPAKAWARPRLSLVDDEAMTGWQRAMTVADSGSGISMAFSPEEYPAINTDLIVVLDRDPQGEWIGMDSVTTVAPGGGATARTDILDHTGQIGVATQTLLVGRRPR